MRSGEGEYSGRRPAGRDGAGRAARFETFGSPLATSAPAMNEVN